MSGWVVGGIHVFFVLAKAYMIIIIIIFVSFSSNDAPFGEYGVSNVALMAVTSGQLISRTLSFDITRSGGNLGTTQVTVNITYDQVKKLC